MGCRFIAVLTVITLGAAIRADAQFAGGTVEVVNAASASATAATREDVVARLMSFDLNRDGQLTRAELPERMHHLLARGDLDSNLALGPFEVQRLAESPTPLAVNRQFQPGQYGFGEGFGLDTRLHIEGAIEDLRLAEEDRDRAFAIARIFEAARKVRITTDLVETMAQMLTSGSLADFRAAIERQDSLERQANSDRVLASNAVSAVDAAGAQRVLVSQLRSRMDVARVIDKYGLQPAEQQRALDAITLYRERKGALSEGDRLTLLEQLAPVMDDQQLDDLRAALERRPIVKQRPVVFLIDRAQNVVVIPAQPADQPQRARIERLVIKQ